MAGPSRHRPARSAGLCHIQGQGHGLGLEAVGRSSFGRHLPRQPVTRPCQARPGRASPDSLTAEEPTRPRCSLPQKSPGPSVTSRGAMPCQVNGYSSAAPNQGQTHRREMSIADERGAPRPGICGEDPLAICCSRPRLPSPDPRSLSSWPPSCTSATLRARERQLPNLALAVASSAPSSPWQVRLARVGR